jgi:hypothetical protein
MTLRCQIALSLWFLAKTEGNVFPQLQQPFILPSRLKFDFSRQIRYNNKLQAKKLNSKLSARGAEG